MTIWLTRISQNTIVNLSLIIVKTLENYGMCCEKPLSRVSEVKLPPHETDKALADQFASLFHNKIKTIRDTFIPSGTENNVCPSSDPPKITAFTEVPQDTVGKIIRNSPTKSCLLDPWPIYFSSKSVVTYFYHQLQSWLTAHSWRVASLTVSKLL